MSENMVFSWGQSALKDWQEVYRSLAVIRYRPDGTIRDANANFLRMMGYTRADIQGRDHSMFVAPSHSQSHAYREFWDRLRAGLPDTGEYLRVTKGGQDIWLQATYIPVKNRRDRVRSVVGVAIETTRAKCAALEATGKLEALGKAQAVIEFDLDGQILSANDNFTKLMGYDLAEIVGRHHRMFVDQAYANSDEYRRFWDKLRQGEFDLREYKRIAKGGKEVWIQASYNPVLRADGKPFKVVKVATDVTQAKLAAAEAASKLGAISKAQAVIEFDLDGLILAANENFTRTLGYELSEIIGRHHRMFVEPAYAQSEEYRQFWEKLRHGEFDSRAYRRIGKGGREVWIQASYNPIMDMNGKPFKVVKFATDITPIMHTADMAEQTNTNVQNVAAAVEEMSASILEISRNMAQAKAATQDILERTGQSSAAASQLMTSMTSMVNVVTFIEDIADQVNLLALNATIEAARAGESGKGFAVVAAEVKNLANQASKATKDIAREISLVQGVSTNVVETIKHIVGAADSVNHSVTGVASAIEEQSTVTREISSNTQGTSHAVAQIASRIKALANGA